MRDEQPQYRAKSVQTLGVNPAPVASHDKYVAKFKFTFPLLSDPDKRVAAAYRATRPIVPLLSALGESILPGALSIARTVYLIDRDGTIRFAQRGMPAAEAILAPLAEP